MAGLNRKIKATVTETSRQTAEIETLLDSLPETAWPCGGCPEKVYGFIADVLDPTVMRDEWGEQGSRLIRSTREV